MKITFNGHQQTQREAELSQQELYTLFEVMKKGLLDNVEFGTFDGYSSYNDKSKKIVELCEVHNVDVTYTKDRLNFFKSIIEEIGNPYA
jgi:hypothetical protein